MIEWRVIEQREQTSCSGDGDQSSVPGKRPGKPGLLNYLVAGAFLALTGLVTVFAFGFVLVVVLPIALLGGLLAGWRWRRMLWSHDALRRHQARQRQESGVDPNAPRRDIPGRDDEQVIDI